MATSITSCVDYNNCCLLQTSSSARVVNQLLTEMDGLESRKQVFLMGATNRPGYINLLLILPYC